VYVRWRIRPRAAAPGRPSSRALAEPRPGRALVGRNSSPAGVADQARAQSMAPEREKNSARV
jgi:hypothetical protein